MIPISTTPKPARSWATGQWCILTVPILDVGREHLLSPQDGDCGPAGRIAMEKIFDLEAWRLVVVNSLSELGTRLASFIPGLVGAVLILLLGWVVSRILGSMAAGVLHRVGLDRAAERLRLAETLHRAGWTEELSTIIGRLLYWIVMLTFLLSAVETLGLVVVTSTIDRLIGYLPNVIAAGLILVIGLLIGRLAQNLVSSGAAAANMIEAARLGVVVNAIVVLIVSVLALEQLGIETRLLVSTITVLLGATGLTMGFAFALGARQIIAHILAGHFLRQSLTAGGAVEVRGRQGQVERVGPVDTLIQSGDQVWSIPNATLLEESIGR
jgi:hypothetical protein